MNALLTVLKLLCFQEILIIMIINKQVVTDLKIAWPKAVRFVKKTAETVFYKSGIEYSENS